jgi:hypothetical protein
VHSIQGVGLAATPGRPLGPVDLNYPLATVDQQPRQPSAVTTRAFDREAASAGDMNAGEGQQPLVASRVSGHGHLPEQTTNGGDGRCGQGVAWVSTPMTPSTRSASMVRAPPRLDSLVPAWRTPHGEPVMSHNPSGLDRLLYQARSSGARLTPAPGRQLVTKATSGCLIRCESCRAPGVEA